MIKAANEQKHLNKPTQHLFIQIKQEKYIRRVSAQTGLSQ